MKKIFFLAWTKFELWPFFQKIPKLYVVNLYIMEVLTMFWWFLLINLLVQCSFKALLLNQTSTATFFPWKKKSFDLLILMPIGSDQRTSSLRRFQKPLKARSNHAIYYVNTFCSSTFFFIWEIKENKNFSIIPKWNSLLN